MQPLLTVAQVAHRLRVTRETVRRWLRSGHLRGTRLGDRAGWRVHPDDLAQMVGLPAPEPVPVRRRVETVYTFGVVQDRDGTITKHMHPPGESDTGAACQLCATGIPWEPSGVRRVVEGNVSQLFNSVTGELLSTHLL